MRAVYHLPLRQAEGFLRSVLALLGLDLPVPDHTTPSRRGRALGKIALRSRRENRPLHIAIDSTGLRVHAGQRFAPAKHRAWRKLHLAVDRDSGEILGTELSGRKAQDAARVPRLLAQMDRRVASACADGAYDRASVYESLMRAGTGGRVRILNLPKRAGQPSSSGSSSLGERNRNIRVMQRMGWREGIGSSGYTARERIDNVFWRYKRVLGREMIVQTLADQRVEVRIGARILSRMAELGMPESYRVG